MQFKVYNNSLIIEITLTALLMHSKDIKILNCNTQNKQLYWITRLENNKLSLILLRNLRSGLKKNKNELNNKILIFNL